MARWIDRAAQLTYDGEEITETVAVGDGGVVVTTHRVLVFAPDGEGEAFSHVDLPNVTAIDERETGDNHFLVLGAKAGIVGIVLLLAGVLLPLDSLVGDVSLGTGAGRLGIGGVVGVIQTLVDVLRNLDTVLLLLGALAFAVAAGALGWYLRTRERHLRILQAGDEPLTLPVGDDSLSQETLQRLRHALEPDGET